MLCLPQTQVSKRLSAYSLDFFLVGYIVNFTLCNIEFIMSNLQYQVTLVYSVDVSVFCGVQYAVQCIVQYSVVYSVQCIFCCIIVVQCIVLQYSIVLVFLLLLLVVVVLVVVVVVVVVYFIHSVNIFCMADMYLLQQYSLQFLSIKAVD